jgi:sugar phosphate isomerase/epimerase
MKYATSQDTLQVDKKTAVSMLADMGFDGIEIVVTDGIHEITEQGLELNADEVDPLSDEIWTIQEFESILLQAKEAGINIPSICLSFFNLRPGLTSSDPTERSTVRKLLIDIIDVASQSAIPVILVPFFLDADISDEPTKQLIVDEISKTTDAAEQANVTLGLETSLPATENLELLQAIDSPAVKLYYDVGNAVWKDYDPSAEIKKLGNQIVQIHVKDSRNETSDVMLGEGRVPFEDVADALGEIGYDGWIVLETITQNNPIEDTRKNLNFIKDVFE